MGFTPTGDILLEINDPEVINAIIITPAIETIKNLKINWRLLFVSIFSLNIKVKLIQP